MTLSKANYEFLAATTPGRAEQDVALAEMLDAFIEARGVMSKTISEVLTQLMLARQPLDVAASLLEAAADLELAALDMGFATGKLDIATVAEMIPQGRRG